MLLHLGTLVVGLVTLYFGAEWLIRGASSLAVSFGIRPMVVGLTVVALGTSLPEFVTNVIAAVEGQDGLAIGNVIGSNVANVGLILGVAALLQPFAVERETLRREYLMMMGALAAFWLFALDGVVGRVDGVLLLVGLVAFTGWLVRDARRRGREAEGEVVASPDVHLTTTRKLVLIAFGAIGLAVGAKLMVDAAVAIADSFGISAVIVGLTVVAIGTSLPELAATVIGVLRGESGLALGNVLGSNLLNVLFVIGIVALVAPLRVEADALTLHFPIMFAFGALVAVGWIRHRLGRFMGAVLLAGYLGYLVFLVDTIV